MKKITLSLVLFSLSAATLWAAVRVNIRLGAGHPIRRAAPRTVVVRPAPAAIVVRERVTYAPPVIWRSTIVTAPPRERIVWQGRETLRRNEDWVDSSLAIRQRGDRLLLRVNGRAQVDFAEVHFGNGDVQVVDFNEGAIANGTFTLLDFANGRDVEHVRLVARARSREAMLSLLMAR